MKIDPGSIERLPHSLLLAQFSGEQQMIDPLIATGTTAVAMRNGEATQSLKAPEGDRILADITVRASRSDHVADYLTWKGLQFVAQRGPIGLWISQNPLPLGSTEAHVVVGVGYVRDAEYEKALAEADWLHVYGRPIPVAPEAEARSFLSKRQELLLDPDLFRSLVESSVLVDFHTRQWLMEPKFLVAGTTAGAMRGRLPVDSLNQMAGKQVVVEVLARAGDEKAIKEFFKWKGFQKTDGARNTEEYTSNRRLAVAGKFRSVRIDVSYVSDRFYRTMIGRSDQVLLNDCHISILTPEAAREIYLAKPKQLQDPVVAHLLDAAWRGVSPMSSNVEAGQAQHSPRAFSMYEPFASSTPFGPTEGQSLSLDFA